MAFLTELFKRNNIFNCKIAIKRAYTAFSWLKRGEDDKIRKRKVDFYSLNEKDIEFAKIALLNLQ